MIPGYLRQAAKQPSGGLGEQAEAWTPTVRGRGRRLKPGLQLSDGMHASVSGVLFQIGQELLDLRRCFQGRRFAYVG
jgi:hypothetical protein